MDDRLRGCRGQAPSTEGRGSVSRDGWVGPGGPGYAGAVPDRTRKRPRDLNAIAASIVIQATQGLPPESDSGTNPAAGALGRLGA